ncbi:MAG: alpha/beta hydrolase-fold protein [Saprospiraceae bacterium]
MKFTLGLLALVAFLFTAEAQPGSGTDYTIGKRDTVYSKILDEEREIFIYLPHGYWGMDEEVTNSPVTIVLDGEAQFLQTASASEFLSAALNGNDLMPRTIVVGIPNTDRLKNLTPEKDYSRNDSTFAESTGGGPQFLDFITKELIPYIDSQYSTIPKRTIIGHSYGGLMAFEALLTKRTYFDNYLVIDPSVEYNSGSYIKRVVDSLRNADLKDEKLFIARANNVPLFLRNADTRGDTSRIMQMPLAGERFKLIATTENWNLDYKFVDYQSDDHFSIPYGATHEGLRYFFDYFPFKEITNYFHPSNRDTDLVKRLKAHFEMISEELDSNVKPMQGYLTSWAFGVAEYERHDLALSLFDYSISLYPDVASAYGAKGYYLLQEGKENEALNLFEKSYTHEEDPAILAEIARLKAQQK